ncbi:MAG: tRNA 2-thiocytidine biosynthesis TtcA family protein [Clostridia bacterium]
MNKSEKIKKTMNYAIKKYNMICDGDKIAIGVSGGKDSLILLATMIEWKKHCNLKFELVAISVDMFNGTYDHTSITNFCNDLGVKLEIVPSNIYEVVFQIRKEKNPCSLCAKLRRGILNSTAKKLGCNKVALAHHYNDFFETFLMSMLFEGRMHTFAPVQYLSKSNLVVIHPFLLVEEKDIISIQNNFPVFKNPCPADHYTKREEMKNLTKYLENKFNCKNSIYSAFNKFIDNKFLIK